MCSVTNTFYAIIVFHVEYFFVDFMYQLNLELIYIHQYKFQVLPMWIYFGTYKFS